LRILARALGFSPDSHKALDPERGPAPFSLSVFRTRVVYHPEMKSRLYDLTGFILFALVLPLIAWAFFSADPSIIREFLDP
jgi:hypothetical protein